MKSFRKNVLWMTGVLLLAIPNLHGQSEYLVVLTYPNSDLNQLYYTNGVWRQQDLTEDLKIPEASSTSSLFDGAVQHIFYLGYPDNHVRELYYSGLRWWSNDLTEATGTPISSPAYPLTSYFDGSVDHVFYLSASDDHFRELFYSNKKWQTADLSAITGAPLVQGGTLSSFYDGSEGHVFYVSDEGHVRELYYNGQWWQNDLTAATGGPSASLGGGFGVPLSSYFDGSVKHVFYISYPDNHVRELYYSAGQWRGNDLTADTSGPQADTLTAMFDGSIGHVFYASTPDNHVRELYNNGQWRANDLTAITNCPPAYSYGTFLVSFTGASVNHVFFVSNNNNVTELYNNGQWWSNVLTGDSGVVMPWGLSGYLVP